MAKKLIDGRKVGSGRKKGTAKTLAEGRKVGSGRKKGSVSKTLAAGRKIGSGRKKNIQKVTQLQNGLTTVWPLDAYKLNGQQLPQLDQEQQQQQQQQQQQKTSTLMNDFSSLKNTQLRVLESYPSQNDGNLEYTNEKLKLNDIKLLVNNFNQRKLASITTQMTLQHSIPNTHSSSEIYVGSSPSPSPSLSSSTASLTSVSSAPTK